MKKREPEPPAAPKPKTYMVRWQCPDCRIFRLECIQYHDYRPRVCGGNAREGGICSEIMNIVHDERAA